MTKLTQAIAVAVIAGIMSAGDGALASDPPLKIVYPFSPGGSGDSVARMLAEHLQKSLSRSVIVENKTGAGGRIGAQAVKSASPDGTTMLFAVSSQITLQPHTLADLGYDPLADFAPIARVMKFDLVLAVSGKVPARSIAELSSWLKNHPEQAAFGTPGAGTAAHFAGLAFARAYALDMRHVPYRGTPAALPDLVSGRLSLFIASLAELIEHHRSGSVQIIATAGAERSSFLADVPTLKESGVEFVAEGWFALYAPARTPPATVERIEKAVAEATVTPEFKAKLNGLGFQATDTSSRELSRSQRVEFDAWKSAVKAAGFMPE